MNVREKRVLDKFGEKELEYCLNMKSNDRESYHVYVYKNINNYVSPSEWFNNIKKKYNKAETLIVENFGNEGLEQYKVLSEKDKAFYYSYLSRRIKLKRKDYNMAPRQWYDNKEIGKLNMDFTEIARELHLDDETVRKIYNIAMQKIRIFIMKNPKFKELEEYL